MVGFHDLSDTDESAVEEMISQAQDACVLDQLAAINCSGITHSLLPTHLETRFRNLKSFPPTKLKSSTNPTNIIHQTPNLSPSKHNLHSGKEGPRQNPKDASVSVSVSSPPFGSASASSPSSDESSMSSLFRPTQKDSVSSNSPSPPRRRGCLCFSPNKKSKEKKKKKKKSTENLGDEFLSELGSFSTKEQQKMLKKAMKEEEKVNREAEKIVQWAKSASARMNIKDELSDDE